MKQKEAIDAYGAILRLSEIALPLQDAYKIFCLRRKIEPIYQFEVEREKALLGELNGALMPDGSVQFKNTEDCVEFKNKVAELNDMEVEADFEPIQIKIENLGKVEIKPADISRLCGFVEFVK